MGGKPRMKRVSCPYCGGRFQWNHLCSEEHIIVSREYVESYRNIPGNKVKYLCTGPVARYDAGDVLEGTILLGSEDGDGRALIYLPPEDGFCGSISVCKRESYTSDYWVSIDEEAYINVEEHELEKLIKSLEEVENYE